MMCERRVHMQTEAVCWKCAHCINKSNYVLSLIPAWSVCDLVESSNTSEIFVA